MRRNHQFAAAASLVVVLSLPGRVVHAQSAENVAIVINDDSPHSQRIGEHYARSRALPASNILRIRTSTEEAIERAAYVATIEAPIGNAIRRAGLHDRILYLVLTKGIPLRIAGTLGLGGTMASVDSELTLLYRRLTGQTVSATGRIDNPYFLGAREVREARPFTHRDHDIYLVTRIDAFTVDEALTLVERAKAPRTEGHVVLDQRSATENRTGDEWLERAGDRMAKAGHSDRVIVEKTSEAVRNVNPVLGYSSWGATDPGNRVRSVKMGFVPGSIATNISSFDARTFREPPHDWVPAGSSSDPNVRFEGSAESLIGDLIREGVTGVSGQVAEPYLLGAVRPEVLFPAYLAGFNLAEAFYLATPVLSWQTVIVGDPLCTPFARKTLTRADLEADTDPDTDLPGLFSKRRIAEVASRRFAPERAIVASIRAETLFERGDRPGARLALEEAVRLSPQTADWLMVLATLQDEAGEYDSAIDRYRRVLQLQPKNVVALNNLAYALAVRRSAPGEALPFAKRAIVLAPANATVLDTLGWIEHLLGNHTVAIKLLADAIQMDPRIAEIHLHAAAVFVALGTPERAESELKEALRLDPSLAEEVQRIRAQLEKLRTGIRY